jgi:hypothetical protein
MLIRLFPLLWLPDASPFSRSRVSDSMVVARDGDRGRFPPVNSPLNADTVLPDVDFVRVLCDRAECDESEAAYLSCSKGDVEVLDKGDRVRFGSSIDVGDETMPCARIYSMTSMSPLGSVLSGLVAAAPSPARIDL